MKKLIITSLTAILIFCILSASACSKNNSSASISRSREKYDPMEIYSKSYYFPFFSSENLSQSSYSGIRPTSRATSVFSVSTEDIASFSMLSSDGIGVSELIDYLGEITQDNYLKKEQFLQRAENKYNELPESEKTKVTNYDKLILARKNFNDYSSKVIDDMIIEIDNALNYLSSFEYSSEYKTVLEETYKIYYQLDSIEREKISTKKSLLDEYNQTYLDHFYATSVITLFNNLPTAILDVSVGSFRQFLLEFDKLSNLQKSLLSNEIIDKASYIRDYIDTNYNIVEECIFANNGISNIFKLSKQTNPITLSLNNSPKLNNVLVSNAVIFDSKNILSITTPYGGILSIYSSKVDNCDLILKKGSSTISDKITLVNGYCSILLPTTGCYSLAVQNSSISLCAVSFQ